MRVPGRPIKKVLSLKSELIKLCVTFLTLFCFISGMVFPLPVKASSLSVPAVQLHQGTDIERISQELDISSFEVPGTLGTVKHRWEAETPEKTVIHIQDAHSNYFCQKKIKALLEHLSSVYGITEVNLEGGEGSYDLSVFTSIEDDFLRKTVAESFLREGLINGSEYFAIRDPERVDLWGVETLDLYLENLEVYRRALLRKERTDRYFKQIKNAFSALKERIYSEELLKLDKRLKEHLSADEELFDYLLWLIEKARSGHVSLNGLDNILIFEKLAREENELDFEQADFERDELLDGLKRKLSRNAYNKLGKKTTKFHKELISEEDYYYYLLDEAESVGIDTGKYESLECYIQNVRLFSKLDKTKVTSEVSKLEERLKESYFENEEQKKLDELSKRLSLLERIFSLRVSREEYDHYKEDESSFGVNEYVRFINRKAHLYGFEPELSSDIYELDVYRREMAGFYEFSLKRDKVFIENLAAGEESVLVTGGFHTENLLSLFRKNDISYVSIMPNFEFSEEYENPYFSLLSGKSSGLKEKLYAVTSSASAIQIASLLSGAFSSEVWGPDHMEAFHAAVFVRSEIAKGREVTGVHTEGGQIVFSFSGGEEAKLEMKEFFDRVRSGRPESPTQRALNIAKSLMESGKDPGKNPLEQFKKKGELVVLKDAAMPAISQLLDSDEKLPRTIAYAALAEIDTEGALQLLKSNLERKFDTLPGETAAKNLGRKGVPALPHFKSLVESNGLSDALIAGFKGLPEDMEQSPELDDLRKTVEELEHADEFIKSKALLMLEHEKGLSGLLDIFEERLSVFVEERSDQAKKDFLKVTEFLSRGTVESRIRNVLDKDPVLRARLMDRTGELLALFADDFDGNISSSLPLFEVENLIAILKFGDEESGALRMMADLYLLTFRKNELFPSGSSDRDLSLLETALTNLGGNVAIHLTGTEGNVRLYKLLFRIGDSSVVPYLLSELKRFERLERSTEETSYFVERSVISGAISNFEKKAVPYLLDELEERTEHYEIFCRLLGSVGSAEDISRLIKLMHAAESGERKHALLKALSEIAENDEGIKTNEQAREEMFGVVRMYLKKDLSDSESDLVRPILRNATSEKNIPELRDLSEARALKTRLTILDAVAMVESDESISFLVDSLAFADAEEIEKAALNYLNVFAEIGMLKSYLEEDKRRSDRLADILKERADESAYASNILGYMRTRKSFDILVETMKRKLGVLPLSNEYRKSLAKTALPVRDIGVQMEALMNMGYDYARLLREEHREMVEEVKLLSKEVIRTPHAAEYATYKNWLIFIAESERSFQGLRGTSEGLLDIYLTERQKVTELLFALRSMIEDKPPDVDLESEYIFEMLDPEFKEASAYARTLVEIGVWSFIREREKVRGIKNKAEAAGIEGGGTYIREDIEQSGAKSDFIISIFGFIPEEIMISFYPDSINVLLDEESYGRMHYRISKGLVDGKDNYHRLSEEDREEYKNTKGRYVLYRQRRSEEKTVYSGILTFGNLAHVTDPDHIHPHEYQHRFFHTYASEDLRRLLNAPLAHLARKVNDEENRKIRRKAREYLVEQATRYIFYSYQDEMLARITDGDLIETGDGTLWVEAYKYFFRRDLENRLPNLTDEKEKQDIINDVFDDAEAFIEQHTPVIRDIVKLKAELFEIEHGFKPAKALEEAKMWINLFLHTIPMHKFGRLQRYKSQCEVELAGLALEKSNRAEDPEEQKKWWDRYFELFSGISEEPTDAFWGTPGRQFRPLNQTLPKVFVAGEFSEEEKKEVVLERKEQIETSFDDVSLRDDTVRVVVGVPKGRDAEIFPDLREINRNFAYSGLGEINDVRQIESFELDENRPENVGGAIERAKDGLPDGGRIVVFAPETDEMKLASVLQLHHKKDQNITVVPDAYTDYRPRENKYPDLMVRVLLARHISFYYNGNDKKAAIKAINDILAKVSGNDLIKEISDLYEISQALRITPIEYQELKAWTEAQKAVATSL